MTGGVARRSAGGVTSQENRVPCGAKQPPRLARLLPPGHAGGQNNEGDRQATFEGGVAAAQGAERARMEPRRKPPPPCGAVAGGHFFGVAFSLAATSYAGDC